MGGELKCKSEFGLGTTFCFSLPFKIDNNASNLASTIDEEYEQEEE
jgi:hypothetical protein